MVPRLSFVTASPSLFGRLTSHYRVPFIYYSANVSTVKVSGACYAKIAEQVEDADDQRKKKREDKKGVERERREERARQEERARR